jgi:undecaprenyl pyrophosphate phosphatase UppP
LVGNPSHPAPAPTKSPISTTDLWISIGALTLTVLLGVAAAAFGFFSLAFLDYCPPESCSGDDAVTAVVTALLVAVIVGVAGLVLTLIQLHRRKPGWPFAVTTLVLGLMVWVMGGVGYGLAIGAWK